VVAVDVVAVNVVVVDVVVITLQSTVTPASRLASPCQWKSLSNIQ